MKHENLGSVESAAREAEWKERGHLQAQPDRLEEGHTAII